MSLLAIAIIRGVIGLCIVAVAIASLVYSFMGEGAGCLNGIILGVMLLIFIIIASTIGDEPLEEFFGTDSMDVFAGLLIVTIGCLFFSASRIAGVISSFAVGFMGLLITGFFSQSDINVLTDGLINTGLIIMLPIALPVILLVVLIGLIFRS